MATDVPRPTVSDLLDYLALDGATYDPDQAQAALDAAIEVQESLCEMEPYTASLHEAALRRAAAILAGRGAPLGQMDAGPFGQFPLIRYDAHIERLEADHRLGNFA